VYFSIGWINTTGGSKPLSVKVYKVQMMVKLDITDKVVMVAHGSEKKLEIEISGYMARKFDKNWPKKIWVLIEWQRIRG